MLSELWTVGETAERLRSSEAAVRLWHSQGRLRAVRVGAKLLFTPESVAAFVRQSTELREGGSEHA